MVHGILALLPVTRAGPLIVAAMIAVSSAPLSASFQGEHPCPSTGLRTGACPGYRKDHIKPLACGGPDAVSNMQWQTKAAMYPPAAGHEL